MGTSGRWFRYVNKRLAVLPRRKFFRCGARFLCPRARWRQDATPRPSASNAEHEFFAAPRSPKGGPRDAGPDAQFVFLRLVHPHDRIGRRALQSD